MKVKMQVHMSGTRSGEQWPAPGEVLEVDDDEGAQLCAAGIAVPVREDKTEKATAPEPETRAATKATKAAGPKGNG